MKVCIVEDQRYRDLFPLTKTRPVFGLRCGKFTIEERILQVLTPVAEQISYIMRPGIESVWKLKNKTTIPVSSKMPGEGDRLYLNGRILFDEPALDKIISQSGSGESAIWLAGDTWAAIFVSDGYPSPGEEVLVDDKAGFSSIRNQFPLNVNVINHPWDLIEHNSAMIEADFAYLDKTRNRLRYPPLPSYIAILNNKNLMIGSNNEIQPFVTFDGTNGPIIIGDNVRIESGAYIKGPVSIGDNCLISANTKLYDNTTLGNTCKIGGEISHSIIHGFSNKRHCGFLGNAYLGEWVNLGAGTNNSNLKNNYNTIKVRMDGKEIDTGNQFIGLFMGDHSRSAIGTTFNTATFVGVGCNIFGEGFPPHQVEDFTWGCIEENQIYNFDKFIQSARRMMIRREIELSPEEIHLLKALYGSGNVVRISSYDGREEGSELRESS